MALFRRKPAADDAVPPTGTPDDAVEPLPVAAEAVDEDAASWEPETPFSRLRGPFDRSEVEADDSRVDLGGIWVPIVPGVEVALQVDESSHTPIGVQLTMAGSGAYLQAYAAPRTEGIWPEIRAEIAQSVVSGGGRADVVAGPLGKELRLHPRGGVPMRLLGVDGPRWFLRALLTGPAATEDRVADQLIAVVRAVVVDRGNQAMAPREQLPLRLPAAAVEPAGPAADTPRGYADLKPFERGPEITEVH